jgi:hypothetical protein
VAIFYSDASESFSLLLAFCKMLIEKYTLSRRQVKLDLNLTQEGFPAFFRMLLEKFGKGADGLVHFFAGALGGCVGGHGLSLLCGGNGT